MSSFISSIDRICDCCEKDYSCLFDKEPNSNRYSKLHKEAVYTLTKYCHSNAYYRKASNAGFASFFGENSINADDNFALLELCLAIDCLGQLLPNLEVDSWVAQTYRTLYVVPEGEKNPVLLRPVDYVSPAKFKSAQISCFDREMVVADQVVVLLMYGLKITISSLNIHMRLPSKDVNSASASKIQVSPLKQLLHGLNNQLAGLAFDHLRNDEQYNVCCVVDGKLQAASPRCN